MENASLLQMFAIDKQGVVRSVEEVSRGLACDCSCPSCGDQLIARQGEVREWHFAHTSGHDCVTGAETALHLAAKQLLVEHKGMLVPKRLVSETVNLADGRVGHAAIQKPCFWMDFNEVHQEMAFGSIRPDVVASINNSYFFIEIAVTHFVDEAKLQFLNQVNVPTVEIDLSEMQHVPWTWDLLANELFEKEDNKKWVRMLDYTQLQKEAIALATQDALSLPISAEVANPKIIPNRQRFIIHNHILDVIDRPFGVAVWSQYDPYLNALVKQVMRLAGGAWQPKFKNWLAPLEARDFLLQAFEELQASPKHNPSKNIA